MELISKCKAKRIGGLLLRMISLSATIAAAVVMATSHQTVAVAPGVKIKVKINDAPALRYFVIANSVASVYGFLVLFVPSEGLLRRLVLATDVVFTMLLSSTISAALAVSQVGQNGNPLAGWRPICGQVPKYCDQVRAALIVGFVGLLCYSITLFCSIYIILNPPPQPKPQPTLPKA